MSQHENKRQGTLYEKKFVVRALEEGLDPHPCPGEYLAHDYLVTNRAGDVFKVQIKGTQITASDERRGPSERFRITAGHGANKEVLDCATVDVLAAYIEPYDAWYLIPCLKVRAKSVWFYPGNEKSKAQYEQFRENWDYFLG